MPELQGVTLPNHWKIEKISDLCEFIVDCIHDTPELSSSYVGYYMIRTSDVGNGYINLDNARFVSQEVYDFRIQRGKPQKGDIIISREAPLGNVGQILVDENICLGQRLIHYRPNLNAIDNRYLLFALLSPMVQQEFRANGGTGSIVDNLRMQAARDLPIPVPPLPEQRAIAGILGALDDKIELNRRMNRTLESMARAVFREMMKDVEEQGSILEFANLLSGGTPRTSEESYWNGTIEWVSAKDVSNANGVFLLDTEKKITQEGVDNSATKLLPAKTVIVTARGTVGAHCMLGKPMTMNQTNYGLKAKEGIGDYFVYFTLLEMVEQLKQQSYGTIFDTITTKTFQNALCAQPSVDVIQRFEEQVTPMMGAILNNEKETRTLASLRDSLLPKLMRGDVRVKSS